MNYRERSRVWLPFLNQFVILRSRAISLAGAEGNRTTVDLSGINQENSCSKIFCPTLLNPPALFFLILTSIRGEVLKTPQQRSSQLEDYSRPWAITRLLPNSQRYTVARFFNRQDAEDHRRFLNRFMPAAEFEILFDVPIEQLQPTTRQRED